MRIRSSPSIEIDTTPSSGFGAGGSASDEPHAAAMPSIMASTVNKENIFPKIFISQKMKRALRPHCCSRRVPVGYYNTTRMLSMKNRPYPPG